MLTAYRWRKDGYKLWLISIFIVPFFSWKWAMFLTIGYVAYLLSMGLIAWWIDSRTKTGQDDFL